MSDLKTNNFWVSLEKEAKKNNPKSFWWWRIGLIGWSIGISVLLTYFYCRGVVDTVQSGIMFGLALSLNLGCSMFLYMLVVMALSERKLTKTKKE